MDSTEQKKAARAANIKALWHALQAPDWDKDGLIDLGKATYARTSLKNLPDKKFEYIFPRLTKIVELLEETFTGLQLAAATAPPPAESKPTGPTGLRGPGPCPVGPNVSAVLKTSEGLGGVALVDPDHLADGEIPPADTRSQGKE